MAKQQVDALQVIGHNVKARISGDMLEISIDMSKSLGQTKGSKEPGKLPNEMVGTTKTHVSVPGTNCKLCLHLTRPMDLDEVERQNRKADAVAQLNDEDAALLSSIDPVEVQEMLALLRASKA